MSESSSALRINADAPGTVTVAGELVFATAGQALERGAGLIPAGEPVRFDVSAVSRGDSAGVALLLEWRRIAKTRGSSIAFVGAAEQLRTIAHTSNLDALFEPPDPPTSPDRADPAD